MSDKSFPLILKTLVLVGKVVDNERKIQPYHLQGINFKTKEGSFEILPNQIRIGVSSCSNITLVLKWHFGKWFIFWLTWANTSVSWWHFIQKGTTCSPKKLSSHTHGSFCQRAKRCPTYCLPSVTSLALVLGVWVCFWEAGMYPTHIALWPTTNRSHELLKVTLGQKLSGYPRNSCGCLYRVAVLKCISHFIMILQGMWKSKMLQYGKYFPGS